MLQKIEKHLTETKPRVNEFKEFALKGNVIDLAVGIIIGAAFTKIVTSLVEDVIMPPLGMVLGKVDFANLYINLSSQPVKSVDAAKKTGIPIIAYGVFLNNIINFIIVAYVIFLLVKQVNRLRRGDEPKPSTRECPFCTSTVSLAATRCPHCTSELSSQEPAPAVMAAAG